MSVRLLSKTVLEPNGRQSTVAYRPGRLKIDAKASVLMMPVVPPDFAVTFLPLVLLVDHLRGRDADVCGVDACLLLKRLYALLGIDARITPVSVTCEPPGEGMSVYGQSPSWEDGAFIGHCVLWLPDLQRLVDPTIQQFPELPCEDGPFIGRVGAAGHAPPGELPVGSDIPIPRDGVQLRYTVLGTEDLILGSDQARHADQLTSKRAADLAGWTLSIMVAPDIASRVRTAPFPRIHALMDAIDGAEVDAGPAGYRFLLTGPDGKPTPTRIDDICLPATAG